MTTTFVQSITDRIQAIDWTSLSHAYGAAEDVPDLLCALLAPEKEERDEALDGLFGNIWHQGTVYEATIYAVPFLIEILKAPETLDKTGIAILLACIADGSGYLEVHADTAEDAARWQSILQREGKELALERQRENDILDRVHNAARECLPLIAPYFADPDPEVRARIAAALGAYPELATTYVPVLEQSLETEEDEDTQAAIETALQRLRSPQRKRGANALPPRTNNE